MSKVESFREQPIEELELLLADARKELYLLRNEQMRNRRNMEKPHRPGLKRKEIARLLTVINEKQSRVE